MNWQQALALILESIFIGTNLNPVLNFRNVVAGPNHPCVTYNYNGAEGYLVQIGANQFIEIPFIVLEVLFNASVENGRVYNSQVFQNNYPQQYNNHGCHVHVIGKIFEISGVAEMINARSYQIL